jgi:hypothetical protein
MIIKGFLDTEIIGLPPMLKDQIKKIMEKVVKGL